MQTRAPSTEGDEFNAFLLALEGFESLATSHDPTSALQLARSIITPTGNLIFLTDSPVEDVSYDTLVLSVGKRIPNAGFTGLAFTDRADQKIFTALLQNYSDAEQVRSWSIVTAEGQSKPRNITLKPNAAQKIEAVFPEEGTFVRLELNEDQFPTDDILPLVPPQPKQISIGSDESDTMSDLAVKLTKSLQNSVQKPSSARPDLSLEIAPSSDRIENSTNRIFFAPPVESQTELIIGPIIAELSPLTEGTNWQGLSAKKTQVLQQSPEDEVLLWQGSQPLIFLRKSARSQSLYFNFAYETSNLAQQPAFIILLHRFIESILQQKITFEALNLETNQNVKIASDPNSSLQIETFSAQGQITKATTVRSALSKPGFIQISQNKQPLLTGAVHFADTREADFTNCAPVSINKNQLNANIQQTNAPDRFTRLWILCTLIAVSAAWLLTANQNRKNEHHRKAFSS